MPRRRHKTNLRVVQAMRQLRHDTRGATAIEYGLIVALIVIAMMATFANVADITQAIWSNMATKVTTAR